MMDALEPIASASSRSRRRPEPRASASDRMTDDLTFEELPPGRYKGKVERVRYSFKAATHIVISYKLDTSHGGVRRIVERLPIHAPSSSAAYFQTALGKGRVEVQGSVARRRSGGRRDQGIAGPGRRQCHLRRHPKPAGGRV